MINFEKIEEIVIPEFNGGKNNTKARMFIDPGKIKIMISTLEKGASIGKHTHNTSCEIIFILKGCAKIILNDKEEIINEGECHYCPKNSTHEIINESNGELEMFCVVPELE